MSIAGLIKSGNLKIDTTFTTFRVKCVPLLRNLLETVQNSYCCWYRSLFLFAIPSHCFIKYGFFMINNNTIGLGLGRLLFSSKSFSNVRSINYLAAWLLISCSCCWWWYCSLFLFAIASCLSRLFETGFFIIPSSR